MAAAACLELAVSHRVNVPESSPSVRRKWMLEESEAGEVSVVQVAGGGEGGRRGEI